MKAIDKVWIVGDYFVAETFRKNFKKCTADGYFLKDHFNTALFCSSKYNDKNNNMLSRLQHSLALALNSKHHLPAYIIIFLDDDLIEFLGYKKFRLASLLGELLDYLAGTFQSMIGSKLKQLPIKAQPREETQIYWIEPALHKNFSVEMIACMDTVIKEHDNMRLLKIKEFWNKADGDLVINNRFTKDGLLTYWKAMDASFRFNVLK